MTTPSLQRETFVTSRLLEYFDVDELAMQIGHEQALWPLALSKELIDNGIDASESAGIAPEVRLSIRDDTLTVEDNGPGLPAAIVARSLDFGVRVSSNSRYVSPTRGQLGHGLKTVFAAAFVANREHGHIEIDTPGIRHLVDVRIVRLAQTPRIEHQPRESTRRNGTLVRIPWPSLASMREDGGDAGSYHDRRFFDLAAGYALFNPHLALTLEMPDGLFRWQPKTVGWQKWMPSSPTSAHWYAPLQLAGLVAAYLVVERETGRVRTVRDLIAEFRGLSSTAKLRSVAEAAGLRGARLADLCRGEEIDLEAVGRLLVAMQQASRPVEGKQLGTIGRESFRTGLVRELGVSDASYRYARVERVQVGEKIAGTTLPVVLEAAFGVLDPDVNRRLVLTGVNWSPTMEPAFPSLTRALYAANVQPDDPVVLAVHLALPAVSFSDRGKGRLTVDVRKILDPAIERVTREWTKAKRQRLRMEQSALKRLTEDLTKQVDKPLTIKAACFQVMERAYLKASANGTLPAKSRQLMYAARPEVMKLTGGVFYKADTQTFQQSTLIDFLEQNPEVTAGWNVVWDDRGHVREPHTDHQVGLGTLGVRRYLLAWTDGAVGDFRSDIDRALDGSALVGTSGPFARYGAVLFIEKEGFDDLFADCAVPARAWGMRTAGWYETSNLCAGPGRGEREQVEAALRTTEAFTLRRAQIVLASARGEWVPAIAEHLGCGEQTVRNAIHAFNARGAGGVVPRVVAAPHHPCRLRRGRRRAAAGAVAPEPAHLRQADQRLDVGAGRRGQLRAGADRGAGQRRDDPAGDRTAGDRLEAGEALDHQPRPGVCPKKGARDRLIRLAATHPSGRWASRTRSGGAAWPRPACTPGPTTTSRCGWSSRRSPRTTPIRRRWPATACWSVGRAARRLAGAGLAALRRRPPGERDHHPVPGLVLQPNSRRTARRPCCWSGTMPPGTSAPRSGLDPRPQSPGQAGRHGVRIVTCYLPIKSPWLNPIEPKWLHGKRRVVEPARLLSAAELIDRVCAAFDCPHEPHVAIPHKVA